MLVKKGGLIRRRVMPLAHAVLRFFRAAKATPRFDLLHVVHLGVARTVCGSAIVALIEDTDVFGSTSTSDSLGT